MIQALSQVTFESKKKKIDKKKAKKKPFQSPKETAIVHFSTLAIEGIFWLL